MNNAQRHLISRSVEDVTDTFKREYRSYETRAVLNSYLMADSRTARHQAMARMAINMTGVVVSEVFRLWSRCKRVADQPKGE